MDWFNTYPQNPQFSTQNSQTVNNWSLNMWVGSKLALVGRSVLKLEHCHSLKIIRQRQYSSKPKSRPVVGVWGACFDQGQRHPGASEGPDVIRASGLLQKLSDHGVDVVDHGDVRLDRGEDDNLENRQKATAKFAKMTHDTVKKILDHGHLALTLGGDHSIGLGTVSASLDHDPDTVVVWVDAHADINTMSTSNSGNMHGMPLSFNIPQLVEQFPHNNLMDWIRPCLDPRRIVYIGLRDVEEAERQILQKLNIPAYFMSDIDKLGINDVVKEALDTVDETGTSKIHLSFDIDALDPMEASATGTPVRGGLTLREGMHICDMIQRTGRLTAMDLVEVNPRLGGHLEAQRTVESAALLVYSALGLRDIVSFHS